MSFPRIRVLSGAVDTQQLLALRDFILAYVKAAEKLSADGLISPECQVHSVCDDMVWSVRSALLEYFPASLVEQVLRDWSLGSPKTSVIDGPIVAGRMIDDEEEEEEVSHV